MSGDTNTATTFFSSNNIKRLLTAAPRLLSSLLPFSHKVNPLLASIKNCGSKWKVAHCSSAGGLLAVLQDHSLEIRCGRINYTEVIARSTEIFYDPFPKWRVLSWFENGTLLAVGYSSGVVQVFTTTAQLLYIIYPPRYVS